MAGEIEHDWRRWGSAHIDDDHTVVRLADIVRYHIGPRFALRTAAAMVLEKVASDSMVDIFLFRALDTPCALSNGGTWIGPVVGDGWTRSIERGSLDYLADNGLDDSNLYDREFGLWAEMTRDAGPFAEAKGDLSKLSGRLGVLGNMHCIWTRCALDDRALDEGLSGRTAILSTDAERLFGYGAKAPNVHQLHSAKPAESPTEPETWDDERLARRRAELGSMKPRIKAPMELLMSECKLQRKDVERRIKSYKAAQEAKKKLTGMFAA